MNEERKIFLGKLCSIVVSKSFCSQQVVNVEYKFKFPCQSYEVVNLRSYMKTLASASAPALAIYGREG